MRLIWDCNIIFTSTFLRRFRSPLLVLVRIPLFQYKIYIKPNASPLPPVDFLAVCLVRAMFPLVFVRNSRGIFFRGGWQRQNARTHRSVGSHARTLGCGSRTHGCETAADIFFEGSCVCVLLFLADPIMHQCIHYNSIPF